MSQIPVIILSGFLGAGKTTLLKRVLQSFKEKNLQITLIMNEFGDVNIDGNILDEDISMKELLQGCLCCSIRDDFTSTLKEIAILEKPDVVVVECTGLANPFEVIESFIQPALINSYKLAKVVSIVDAKESINSSFSPLIVDQMKYADVLLLNKVDLVSEQELEKVTERIQAVIDPYIPVIPTVKCEIPIWDYLTFPEGVALSAKAVEESNHIPAHLESVHSFSYAFSRPINRNKFNDFVSLLDGNVLRMKGFVPFLDGLALVQYTPNEVNYTPIDWSVSEEKIVFIGTSLNKQELFNQLQACED